MFYKPVYLWVVFTVILTGVLSYALPGKEAVNPVSALFLPGETTHGHYQIELKCGACHDPFGGVNENACIDCHQAELDEGRDTHPKSKFRDPSNIPLLEKIDASNCLTCHEEHVEQRTTKMGLTVPLDCCVRCHADVEKDRPSHVGMKFDSCTTAGCHNYHDNRALFEKFLDDHYGEPDLLDNPQVLSKTRAEQWQQALAASDADATESLVSTELTTQWADSVHARAGVNCSGCHKLLPEQEASSSTAHWQAEVGHETCQKCHAGQVAGFLAGKHGMRLASGLSPMTPAQARLPMHAGSFHAELNCMSCHDDHRFDVQYAAVEACLKCHNDAHSQNYLSSGHYQLWQAEQGGEAASGSGVSCATCHLPRLETSNGTVTVEHNQNWNLEPNEKMVRSVCQSCHGLQFTLNSLADTELIKMNFSRPPQVHVDSLEMAHEWFESRKPKKRSTEN